MEFKELLERVLSKEEDVSQIRIVSLKEAPCTKPGQNFMSVVSLAHIEGALPNGDLYRKSVFIKRPTPPAEHTQPFSIDDAFSNEVLMYQVVLPLITSVADVTRIAYPYYYHATGDVILLEDLRAQGYGVGDITKGFDLDTARSILKALARFHAASYYTNAVRGSAFAEAIKDLKPLGLTVSSNKKMMESCLRRVLRCLESKHDLKTAAASLHRLQGGVTQKMRELRKPHHVAVLVHGDFWFNNILTRKDEESKVFVENQIRIVDLQACAFLSPAVDFWLFLYTSVSLSILKNNCDSFIQVYTSEFLKVLNDQKTPSKHILNPSTLKEELSSKELYGFLAAMAYLPALYLNPESVAEIEKATEDEKKNEKFLDRFLDSRFTSLLIEVTRYCCKKGLL